MTKRNGNMWYKNKKWENFFCFYQVGQHGVQSWPGLQSSLGRKAFLRKSTYVVKTNKSGKQLHERISDFLIIKVVKICQLQELIRGLCFCYWGKYIRAIYEQSAASERPDDVISLTIFCVLNDFIHLLSHLDYLDLNVKNMSPLPFCLFISEKWGVHAVDMVPCHHYWNNNLVFKITMWKTLGMFTNSMPENITLPLRAHGSFTLP